MRTTFPRCLPDISRYWRGADRTPTLQDAGTPGLTFGTVSPISRQKNSTQCNAILGAGSHTKKLPRERERLTHNRFRHSTPRHCRGAHSGEETVLHNRSHESARSASCCRQRGHSSMGKGEPPHPLFSLGPGDRCLLLLVYCWCQVSLHPLPRHNFPFAGILLVVLLSLGC